MTPPSPARAPRRGPIAAHPSVPGRFYNRPALTNLLLLILGAALIALSAQLVREHTRFVIGFSGVSGWSALVFLAACAVVLTRPADRATLPIILAVAALCRVVVLPAPPFLSSDIYRYVWDGVVQHAGISPYRYVPGDPALAFLRAPHRDIFDNINRRDYARTIYPPVAQMIFFAATWVSASVTWMKAVMLFFDALTIWALLQILHETARPPQQLLLYAWCPLLVWEVAEAGHLDAVGIAFIALALLARLRRQPWLTGLWLGLAVMVKFYPLVLFPALWWPAPGGNGEPARRGSGWKMPAALAAVIAVGYACYARVGWLVFGFASGYAEEEGMENGRRYFLYELARRLPGLARLPLWAYVVFCAAVFAALTLWAWKTTSRPGARQDSFLAPAFALAFALMLLFSPHYPWYILWLVPFFALQPNPPALVYLMALFYGLTTSLANPGPGMFLLNRRVYGGTAAACILWLVLRRWPLHHRRSVKVQVPPTA